MTAIPKRNAPTPCARTVYNGGLTPRRRRRIPRAVAANERHDPSAATTAKRVRVGRYYDFIEMSLSYSFLLSFFLAFLTRIARASSDQAGYRR